jgi:hypothetical protein
VLSGVGSQARPYEANVRLALLVGVVRHLDGDEAVPLVEAARS